LVMNSFKEWVSKNRHDKRKWSRTPVWGGTSPYAQALAPRTLFLEVTGSSQDKVICYAETVSR